MARKNGLNRKEQIQCAKWLTEGISATKVAKKLHTSAAVVKKFTQAGLDKAAANAKDRAEAQGKVAQKQKKQAAVLKKVLDTDVDFK